MLAVAFGICFVTGYLSHAIQHPPWWFAWPSRPINLYRVTQGLHVATGLATVPLLAAKLWSVYLKLFRLPSLRDPLQLVERLSLVVLVSAALFQLTTGILNIARWYQPMGFFFTVAHYWTAWAAIGALLTHVGVKLPIVRRALAAKVRAPAVPDGLSRRGLLGAAAGVVTLTTVGQTVRPLAAVSVLAPRDPRVGSQGLPVNQSAIGAGVVDAASDPKYLLEIVGPSRTLRLGLAELAVMPQHTATLPITCVEGWSAAARWTGIRLRDLAEAVSGDDRSEVTVVSLQRFSPYAQSLVAPPHLRDPLTLLALRLNGETLHLDHGYPCRLIAPNRPGVMQTKWVGRLIVGSPV